MKGLTEFSARLFAVGLILGLALAIGWFRLSAAQGVVEVHARVPEEGGWLPADLTARVGEPLRLRLTSDDVVHGFALGQSGMPPVDVLPGKVVETVLNFPRPGKYTFYCTRWCGVNHWRMRGTIEVTGSSGEASEEEPPLYVRLGLDIDAEHLAETLPQERPSATRGSDFLAKVPEEFLSFEYYQSHSPAKAWMELRATSSLISSSDQEIWDLVAAIWVSHSSERSLEEGKTLFAENCAACHGETGAGDGVFAELLASGEAGMAGEHENSNMRGQMTTRPLSFVEVERMLGASPAVLHGKIVRGGMGTGMPYWGPIFTDAQVWALVGYLWTFQFSFQ